MIRDLKNKYVKELSKSGLKPSQYIDGINTILLAKMLEKLESIEELLKVEEKTEEEIPKLEEKKTTKTKAPTTTK